MTKKNRLRILFIEDLPSDVDLAVLELRKEKLMFEHTTVCARNDLIKALKEFKPDLIISDYMMQAFNGLQALKEVKESDPDIPFILCTGSVNEETAVACLKAGAEDYVIKEHMTRLPFAVKEALEKVSIYKERRASELLLIESEEKLQSIFSATPAGIGLVINRTYIEVNDTFCRMTGYKRNEIIGKSSVMMYPTKEEFEIAGFEKYEKIAKKGIGSVETRLKCKDGRILNIISTSTPLDPQDMSKGVTFTVLDITDHKQAEEDLAKTGRVLSTLIGNLHGMVYRCRNDNNRTMEFLSEGTRELTGYSPEDFLNNSKISYNDIIHKDDRDYVWTEVQAAIKTKKHYQLTYRIITSSGEIRWVWENGEGVFSQDGELEFLEGIITDISQRKNMEETLRESQQLFETLTQTSPVGIFRTRPDGYTTYVNPKWEELSGLTSEEAIGFGWLKAVHPDDREKLEGRWNSDVQSQRSSVAEYRFLKPDGSIIWVMGKAVPELSDGKVAGYVGTITDITNRKHTEKALQKSEEKFRSIAENLSDIIFITDTAGVIKYISPSSRTIGYTPDDCIGRFFGEFLPEGEIEKAMPFFINALNSVNPGKSVSIMFKRKDGIAFFADVTGSVFEVGDGETGILGLVRDVTYKKIMESAVVASEQRYRELFLNNPVPTYIFDENTLEFIQVNDATVQNYGYSRKDFASMTLKDIRLPEDIPELMESVRALDNTVYHSISMRHRRKDGTVFPVEITSHSLPEKNGRKTRLVMATDISQRLEAAEQMKLAKEKAEASDNLKTTFLNNISHEVRTPLNGILGFAEILSQPGISDEEHDFAFETLHSSSDRLLNTITNYMDISLLASENMTVCKREFRPDQILTGLFNQFNKACSLKNVRLALQIPEKAKKISINSDPEKLKKIFSQLLSNAVKFTDKGSIEYGYKIINDELEFYVKDTGIGITKGSITIIFDRFVKEDRGPSRLSEGSGLGLSITKGLVELMGGIIRVESELEVGSKFFFTLPVKYVLSDFAAVVSDLPDEKTWRNDSILVAEDDENNFFFLNAVLTRELGMTVLHASNGREAIELFKANPDIKLILMDIKMPEIDGIEATRQIKLIKPDVPVIAITAYAMSGDEERVLSAGCNGYLSKPINIKTLMEKMAEFIMIR